MQGASASTRTIALVTDTNDWHARALGKAFADLGAQTHQLKLRACSFDTATAHGLRLPDFDLGLPDAVLVRDMAGGTFEAVTLRLAILHALQEIGVPVWNAARSIERCVDKSTTSFLLARAGLPTPMTWATESREAAAEAPPRLARAPTRGIKKCLALPCQALKRKWAASYSPGGLRPEYHRR